MYQVDRLAVNSSSIHLLQENKNLKQHNIQVSNNIEEELCHNFNNTMQVLQFKENTENLPPPYYLPPPDYSQPLFMCNPSTTSPADYDTDVHQLLTMQQRQRLPLDFIQQLTTDFQSLKNQLVGSTLSNQNKQPRPFDSTNSDLNPKSCKPWRHYCWTCDCCPR